MHEWTREMVLERANYCIVCPDGVVRRHPYGNEGDAECDAGILTDEGCVGGKIDKSPCPGGLHTSRQVDPTRDKAMLDRVYSGFMAVANKRR